MEKIVQGILGVTALGFLAPIFAYLAPKIEKSGRKRFTNVSGDPIQAKDIPDGESQIGLLGGEPTIVVRQGGELTAFSAVCTHLGCIVQWEKAERVFFCPCHAGKFNANGVQAVGPPPSPLPRYKVVIGSSGEIELEAEQS
jgi:cytochrome b6-f complex iron-sulfur subunit